MGGIPSKSNSRVVDVNDQVRLCRERKRQLELALERRSAFADAQCKYIHSLLAVGHAVGMLANVHTQNIDSTFSDSEISTSSVKVDGEEDDAGTTDGEVVCRVMVAPSVASSTQRDSEGGEMAISSEKEGDSSNMNQTEGKAIELLEALKAVEKHFFRTYHSGMEVSRMLETNMVQVESASKEIKEKSEKFVRSMTVSHCASSRFSSKIVLRSSSRTSSTCTYFNSGLDDHGKTLLGGHSSTLASLYDAEKKLYEEVKIVEKTKKRCVRLQKQRGEGDVLKKKDRIGVKISYLDSKISNSYTDITYNSKKIQKLRDELQAQVVKLFQGLMRNSQMMSEAHEMQKRIMSQVKCLNSPSDGMSCNDLHQLATSKLEDELQKWCSCFASYVSSQKAYVKALHGGIFKFAGAENGSGTPDKSSLYQSWLDCLQSLPDEAVTCAMKDFGKDVRALVDRQRKEHRLKKEIAEELKEQNKRNRPETEMKEQLGKKLDTKKAKTYIAVSRFQTGFSTVFESLVEYSNNEMKMYENLIACSGDANEADNESINSS
ncbi:protein ALTERED PHOSPHATE STARVATION RESPONSE 1-like [Pyrus x bretschneideri]|uniref:protein ALTERED PHOSPHATE STARVATION RESPONSE 1-like n=1 Tax=Pyrus x bretschneideri TaxID=225117 RepID=UPI002030274A|nr:protein ALTERED PHOSPHATE STARVATION RESPONSE 1-like [Pyrus x bretschneideri]